MTPSQQAVVLPLKVLMADNLFDAYLHGMAASVRTGYTFTNSFVDVDKTKGIHIIDSDGVDVVLLSEEYNCERV
jgi:hypothetical protein